MDSVKYIGMDVHKEAIAIAVLNSSGKLVMPCVIETKPSSILQLFQGLSAPCNSENLGVVSKPPLWFHSRGVQ